MLTVYSPVEAPNFESLVAEQGPVQEYKHTGRLLEEYNFEIGLRSKWRNPVKDMLQEYAPGDASITFEGVLSGMHAYNDGDPIEWVDLGAGRALAMRQFATDPARTAEVNMTAVDLFDRGLSDLTGKDLAVIEKGYPGAIKDAARPRFVRSDLQTATLLTPADVITSVETVQYLDNPLGAIANAYNQTRDDGVVLFAAAHDWSENIHYVSRKPRQSTPTEMVCETLADQDISFAVREFATQYGEKIADFGTFCVLAIQKSGGTRLEVPSPVVARLIDDKDYKTIYYDPSQPVLRVTKM